VLPVKSPVPAAARKRLAWFHADLRRRIRRFEARLARAADDKMLLAEVRAACAALPPIARADEIHGTLRSTAAGRTARVAIDRALADRRLPPDLAAWIAWVALHGESLVRLLAADYREERVGPHARHVREPVTGDKYLEIRVPAEWTAKTIVAALPYLRDPSIFSGVEPPSDTSGGRPQAVTPEEALELARRFDAQLAPTLGGKRLAVKTWLAKWDRWLARESGDAPRPRAAWLWRTTVKAAVETGTFVPAALEVGRVRRLRRSG
jgi:hypothetical protein